MQAIEIAHAPVAQLDRVTDYESVGQGFESLPAYQKSASLKGMLISIVSLMYAPVAQLDRVTDYESVGQGFESLPAYHNRYRN